MAITKAILSTTIAMIIGQIRNDYPSQTIRTADDCRRVFATEVGYILSLAINEEERPSAIELEEDAGNSDGLTQYYEGRN